MKYYSTNDIAKMDKISQRGVSKRITSGHYPNAKRCACGSDGWIIPSCDVENFITKQRGLKNKKDN